jgi:small subunit ribosomal protein S20
MGYNVARILEGIRGGNTTLANTKSAIKRVRSNERKRKINQVHRSRARTFVKKTRKLIAEGQLEQAEIVAQQAISALDKAAQKGVIHQNNAARHKSRLMKHLNQAKQQAA